MIKPATVRLPHATVEHLSAALMLGLVALVLLAPAWPADRVLAPADLALTTPLFAPSAPATWQAPANSLLFDQTYQFIPWRYWAWHSLQAGQWPLWNPHSGTGQPQAATLQAATFYPLHLALNGLPFERALLWSAAIRLWVAGFAAYGLARHYGLTAVPAGVTGLAFMLSGFVVVWLGHPHTLVAVWLPALLLFAHRLMTATTHEKLWMTVGVAGVVGMQVTGGHVETLVDCLVTLAVYLGAHMVFTAHRPGRWLVWLGAALMLGLALAAAVLLPFVEWLPLSAELAARQAAHEAFVWFDPNFWKPTLTLALAVFPNLFNNPTWNTHPYWSFFPWGGNYNEQVWYVGTFTWVLALIGGLNGWRRNPWVMVWLVVGGLSLGRALHWPGFAWLNQLPVLNLGNPDRLRLVVMLALALLAGFGAQALWYTPTPRLRQVWHWALSLTGLAGGLMWLAGQWVLPALRPLVVSLGRERVLAELAARTEPPQYPLEHYYAQVETLADGLLAAFRLDNPAMYAPVVWAGLGLLWLVWHSRATQASAPRLAALVVLWVDLFTFAWGYNPAIPLSAFYPAPPVLAALRWQAEPYRITALRQDSIPETHLMLGWDEVRTLDFSTRWFNTYLNLTGDRLPWLSYGVLWRTVSSPLVQVLNVRYVLASRPEVLQANPALTVTGPVGGVYVGEFTAPTPRAFMVYAAHVAADEAAAAEHLRLEPGAVFTRVVVLAADQPPRPAPGAATTNTVTWLSRSNQYMSVRVTTASPGYLFNSEAYYPGWQAAVDGVPVPLYRANLAFRAVWVPAGEHSVTLHYVPLWAHVGAVFSLLAALVMVALLVLAHGRWLGWLGR